MKKKVICIIDFGQSHLKFLLLTETFIVARIMIFKNNFKVSKKNKSLYNVDKIINKVRKTVKSISLKYQIESISFVAHGSACFYKEKDKNIKSGYHFSSKNINYKLESEFLSVLKKTPYTFTKKYRNFHNLGKNFFYLKNDLNEFQFFTLTSLLANYFTGQNISDPSYISCHSYLWNFKLNSYSKLTNSKKKIYLPKIKKGGELIKSKVKHDFHLKSIKIFNGCHDSSAAFFFHKAFFSNKNTIFLSTGTSFVIGAYIKNFENLNKKIQFNLLQSPDQKGFFYSQSFENKKFIENLKTKKKDIFIKIFLKINKLNRTDNITLVIDGPLIKDKVNLKLIKNIFKFKEIYCIKNQNAPSFGILRLIQKKNNFKKEKFYKKLK